MKDTIKIRPAAPKRPTMVNVAAEAPLFCRKLVGLSAGAATDVASESSVEEDVGLLRPEKGASLEATMPVRVAGRTEVFKVWLETVEEDLVEEDDEAEANKLFVEVEAGVALLDCVELLLGVLLEEVTLSFGMDVVGAGVELLGGG